MRTRYEAYLDGVPVSDVSQAVCVTDIREEQPDETLTVNPNAVKSGSRRIRKVRSSLRVVVEIVIAEQKIDLRRDACKRVQDWAQEGRFLSVNDRPSQRLRAVCEGLPRVESTRNWQERIEMEFAAYALPFWEAEDESNVTVTGTGSLYVEGNSPEKAHVSVSVTNNGETASNVTLTCGDTQMRFEGIAFNAGSVLEVGYTHDMVMFARLDGESILAARTTDSDDDLLAENGRGNDVSVSGGNFTAAFGARGLFE